MVDFFSKRSCKKMLKNFLIAYALRPVHGYFMAYLISFSVISHMVQTPTGIQKWNDKWTYLVHYFIKLAVFWIAIPSSVHNCNCTMNIDISQSHPRQEIYVTLDLLLDYNGDLCPPLCSWFYLFIYEGFVITLEKRGFKNTKEERRKRPNNPGSSGWLSPCTLFPSFVSAAEY